MLAEVKLLFLIKTPDSEKTKSVSNPRKVKITCVTPNTTTTSVFAHTDWKLKKAKSLTN